LTAFDSNTNPKKISGHSVMMGYLDEDLNEKAFLKDSLKITKY